MTVDPVNRSPLVYSAPSTGAKAPESATTKAESAPEQKMPDSAELQRIVAELDDAEQQKVAQKNAGADGVEEPAGEAKAFAYGALGMDHPDTVKEENGGAYTAGQVLSAIGTIGGIIALMV